MPDQMPLSAPRIAPLEPPYRPEIDASLRRWMPAGSGADPLALFRTLNVHAELASRMRPLGAGILGHGLIAPRERELMILRTCARAGAEYEWGVHAVAFGSAVGLTEEQIRASARGAADDSAWEQGDRALIALADELHEDAGVSDGLWSELADRFSSEQLIELLVTAGWYRLLSYVLNGARVPLEPWAARFPR